MKDGQEMFTVTEFQESHQVLETPAPKQLNEAAWQAWLLKGRARDRLRSAARIKVVKWTSIVVLLTVAGLWSLITPYEVAVRFALTAGAMIVMFQALHVRHYALATVFGVLALLYNPVVPLFSFSGSRQRAVVIASAALFAASLAWPGARTENK
jgi:hypothetical protein